MLKKLSESRDRSIVFSLSVPRVIRRSMLGMLLALVAVALARAADPDCLPKASLPQPEIGQPRNISDLKNELLFYKCSGAYDREFSEVIDQAIAQVVHRAKENREKDHAQLAIVLDIDETSLSNWEEMKANDFGLIEDGPCTVDKSDALRWPVPAAPCGFGAWVLLAGAKPLDTLRLYQTARANNVAVFFITGRKEINKDDHRVLDATSENLRKAGYEVWDGLMLRSFDDNSTIQDFKTAKRIEIERKLKFKIIANVGDQYSDLRGRHAEQIYKLPNPFYFVP
jgi:hypothetical protein